MQRQSIIGQPRPENFICIVTTFAQDREIEIYEIKSCGVWLEQSSPVDSHGPPRVLDPSGRLRRFGTTRPLHLCRVGALDRGPEPSRVGWFCVNNLWIGAGACQDSRHPSLAFVGGRELGTELLTRNFQS